MTGDNSNKLLKTRLTQVPEEPGVYLHKNAAGEVIYVGKASKLRSRLRYYFNAQPNAHPRTVELIGEIADFDYLLTATEQQALLLENNLIKQHKPCYNVHLQDDKSYPFIKFDLEDPFPRVYVTRHPTAKKARYFGPYASAGSVHRTLRMLKKLFPYRSCTMRITGKEQRPCLEYYIKRCVAPCTSYATREQYGEVIKQAMDFLEHGTSKVVSALKKDMRQAAGEQNFEKAAVLRDRIRDLENLAEKKTVTGIGDESFDVIAATIEDERAILEVLFVRGGNLIGHDRFHMAAPGGDATDEADVTESFIVQHYISNAFIPPAILTNAKVKNAAIVENLLRTERAGSVKIGMPQRGAKKRLSDMAKRDADNAMKVFKIQKLGEQQFASRAMDDLQEFLNLPVLPKRIECYDISHVQGSHTVASAVVFENGHPKPSHYRKFKVRTVRNDDYAAMREVLDRRLTRLTKPEGDDNPSFGARPDLIVVDGGKGQLNEAKSILLQKGLDISLVALAKREELIYLVDESEPLDLPQGAPALQLLQRIRDEAHRFAVTYHRQRRKSYSLRSLLDSVPRVGTKRKQALLRRFGSAAAIKEAPLTDIAAVPGMTMRLARTVKEFL